MSEKIIISILLRNYDVSPLSESQYKAVMGYIKNETWSKVGPKLLKLCRLLINPFSPYI